MDTIACWQNHSSTQKASTMSNQETKYKTLWSKGKLVDQKLLIKF